MATPALQLPAASYRESFGRGRHLPGSVSSELSESEEAARERKVRLVAVSHCRQSVPFRASAAGSPGRRPGGTVRFQRCEGRSSPHVPRDAASDSNPSLTAKARAARSGSLAIFPWFSVRRDGWHSGLPGRHAEVETIQGRGRTACGPRKSEVALTFPLLDLFPFFPSCPYQLSFRRSVYELS